MWRLGSGPGRRARKRIPLGRTGGPSRQQASVEVESRVRIGVMKVLTAEVVEGRLDLPEGTLHDGETVTLLVADSEEAGFRLSDAERERLKDAIWQAERGEILNGWKLLDELKA